MSGPSSLDDIERSLGAILTEVSADWSDEQIKHARGDIHHGEYGLAIELIAATLASDSKPITPEIFRRVVALFQRMDLTDSEYLTEFQDYATSLGVGPSVAPHAADLDPNL